MVSVRTVTGLLRYRYEECQLREDYFLDLYPPDERRLAEFAAAARESHEEQSRIEAADKTDLDTYLARYLAD